MPAGASRVVYLLRVALSTPGVGLRAGGADLLRAVVADGWWHAGRVPAPAPQPAADGAGEAPALRAGVVATVGHGRLDGDVLARLVAGAGVVELIDVRRMPFSRRNPQFNRDRLAATLAEAGVTYHSWESLGGRRETTPDSPNEAVTPADLRGYADHLATEEGRGALAQLARWARAAPVAVMCAEGDPRRCHRRLLADALEVAAGLVVVHLAHDGSRTRHRRDPSVRTVGGVVRWDRGVDRPLEA